MITKPSENTISTMKMRMRVSFSARPSAWARSKACSTRQTRSMIQRQTSGYRCGARSEMLMGSEGPSSGGDPRAAIGARLSDRDHGVLGGFLLGLHRLHGQVGARQPLQSLGLFEVRDLGFQHADALALLADIALDTADLGALLAGEGFGQIHPDREGQQGRGEQDVDGPKATGAVVEEAHHAAALQAGAAVRTPARSLAERARGLAAVSASEGSTWPLNGSSKVGVGPPVTGGAWREPPGRRPARAAKKALAMRSSSEWNVTTPNRPPGFRIASAPSRPPSSSVSSSFTAMRRAWKVLVAGWTLAPRRPPRAFSTTSARSSVRSNGRSARRRTMNDATRRLSRSSP